MNEFIEKLIGRLEEEREKSFSEYTEAFELYREEFWRGRMGGFTNAIEIVNQLAEEYKRCALCYLGSPCEYQNENAMMPNELLADKNGWIPCSERLPEENGYYLITIKYYHLHNNVTMGCFFDDGEWWKIDKDDKVIAWQPLPEPYKPGNEHNEKSFINNKTQKEKNK